jgi:hypothetical protein
MRIGVALLALVFAPMLAGADEEATTQVRESIARKLDADAPPWAATVRSPEATVTRWPTPSWLTGAIWRVERFMPTRPLVFYVGVDKSVALLTGKPDAFNRWIRDEGTRVPNAAAAVALARLFAEVTHDTGVRLQILDSAEALPYRPGLAGDDAELRDRSRRELAPQIRPPRATSRGRRGWEVVAFAVDGMHVVRWRLRVARTGEVEPLPRETIRTDLPLVYAN